MRRALLLGCLAVAALACPGRAGGEAAPDPTRPPLRAAEPAELWAGAPLRLSAIWIGPARRLAVIDGRAVEEGDIVEGREVVEIRETSVRVGAGEGVLELRLFGPVGPAAGSGS